jgi:hypothetical protein
MLSVLPATTQCFRLLTAMDLWLSRWFSLWLSCLEEFSMKRSQTRMWAAALLGVAVLAEPVLASNNPLVGAMGNVRWGMRDRDVKSALKGEFSDKGKLTGLEKSYVEFDGQPTPWDTTPLAEEYTHGNNEAMMTVEDDEGVKNYFFFIGGELWKWVKLYPPSAFGARDFNGFAHAIERRFGKGHQKKGEINVGSGKAYRFVEYVDRNTRVRAVDKSKQQGKYALVFESLGTVRSLASLRANSRPGSSARAMTGDESQPAGGKADEAAPDPVASPLNTGAATKSRSIFASEGKNEGAAKARAPATAKKAPPRAEERSRPDKQTRSLDKLLGSDDDDPLTGLP